MIPKHHPAEELLLDYATGALAGGARLVIASHVNSCPSCLMTVSEAEMVGGALLSALLPTALRADALDLALARIERPIPTSGPVLTHCEDWISVPSEVLRAAQDRRRWAAPGVWVASVTRGPGKARSYLLGVGAGMIVPRHTHRGFEMVCVLKGAYRDGETLHRPGDFAFNNEAVDHRPQVTLDGECVCLVTAENALVPLDWVGRLFQPVVGI